MTPADYQKARLYLMRRDPVLGAAVKRIGACGPACRPRTDHLTALSAPSSVSSCRPKRPRRSSAGSRHSSDGQIRMQPRSTVARRPVAGVGSERAEGRLPARSVFAHRRPAAAARRARGVGRRAGDRTADRGEGIRPVDGRDVLISGCTGPTFCRSAIWESSRPSSAFYKFASVPIRSAF